MTQYTACPDENILAAFAEGRLNAVEHEDIFKHIAVCKECRDLCGFAAKAVAGNANPVADRRKKALREKLRSIGAPVNSAQIIRLWNNFAGQIVQLCSFYEQAEVIAAGNEMNTVIFVSEENCDRQHRWKMRLNIPAQQPEAFAIDIAAACDSYPTGKLIFCGNELQVVKGRTQISWEALKNSIHNPEIVFCFADGAQVAGLPEL